MRNRIGMEGTGGVQEVEPDSDLFDQVVKLGDSHRATLGFLPYQVFWEAAASARVLADVVKGTVRGYVLFRRRMRTGEITLTHLCVREDSRGQDVARSLVEELVSRYPNSPGIRLRCRQDFDAHHVWPRLGFVARGERPGRSQRLLTDWWRRIADWSLFDWAATRETRVVAVLDTDVFRDIAEKRDFPASLALENDWVDDVVKLTITAKTLDEVSGSDGLFPDLRPKANNFRILNPPLDDWDPTYQELLSLDLVAEGDRADMQIVAQAITGRARYLITRDRDLIETTEGIEKSHGLVILEPADLIMQLSADDDYQPKFIANSQLRIERLQSIPPRSHLNRYCQYVNQHPADLRHQLAATVSSASALAHWIQLTTEGGIGLALTAYQLMEGVLKVTVLRHSHSEDPYSAMRQIVHFLRNTMAETGGGRVEILDQIGDITARALQDEGFEHTDQLWTAEVRNTITGHSNSLPSELEGMQLTPALISQFEAKYWPCKVFTGVVPSHVVPVKPAFAKTILGYEEAQRQLFDPPVSVTMVRENVYYRRQRGSLKEPARILWWVSGGRREAGMRAISWLDAVDTGNPKRLYRRHGRKGILTVEQVRERAGMTRQGGQPVATALLFSRTEVFSAPVSIERARQLHQPMTQNGYFQSSRLINETSVEAFYREGMNLND